MSQVSCVSAASPSTRPVHTAPLTPREMVEQFEMELEEFRVQVTTVTEKGPEGREFLPGFGGMSDEQRNLRNQACEHKTQAVAQHNLVRLERAAQLLNKARVEFTEELRNYCRLNLHQELNRWLLRMTTGAMDVDLMIKAKSAFEAYAKHVDGQGNCFSVLKASSLYWTVIMTYEAMEKEQNQRTEQKMRRARQPTRVQTTPVVKTVVLGTEKVGAEVTAEVRKEKPPMQQSSIETGWNITPEKNLEIDKQAHRTAGHKERARRRVR